MAGEKERAGTLFLVATPIGNLEDITLRALRVLREADCIACEDTRRTLKLLSHYGIRRHLESHHEHNEAESAARLLGLLRQGKDIALATDAGTPAISDPGQRLVAACRSAGIAVVPLPGPSAALAALTGSGMATDAFLFAGFLPSRSSQRRKRLQELSSCPETLVLYEAPHRLIASLRDALEILGPRRACVARELTKIHEEWLHGGLDDILHVLASRDRIQGEITLVIEGGEPPATRPAWPASVSEHLAQEMGRTGAPRKEALRSVARQRGISRRVAYQMWMREKEI